VVVAITLLPVVLATAGPRLDWPRLRTERSASALFPAWARGVSSEQGGDPPETGCNPLLPCGVSAIEPGRNGWSPVAWEA
jgi:hypothetical protein